VLQVAKDSTKTVRVFGTDYATRDGTCIRDYIHVCDLANAHILALEHLLAGGNSAAFNLGIGHGYIRVREVIECAKKVTGQPITVREEPRRPDDPDAVAGDAGRAVAEMGWQAKFSDLETISAQPGNGKSKGLGSEEPDAAGEALMSPVDVCQGRC
jgi:UDP-glucose 4-epimerase